VRPEPRQEAAPARKAATPPAATSPKGSVLGATLRFKGDLVADEDLVVQGQIEGSILHTRSLTIGPDGVMKGDIRARRIVIEGTVTGDLYALECVTVRSTGHVRGSIYAPRVAIAEGAQFNGKVDMANAPAVPSPVVAALHGDAPTDAPRASAVQVDATDTATDAATDVALDEVDVDDLLDGQTPRP
jgi:cytoskeletal protein CcmA (bactofilin family)